MRFVPGGRRVTFHARESDARRPPLGALYRDDDGYRDEAGDGEMSYLAEALESAGHSMAFHSRDWGANPRDAWLWGLICGWDCDDPHDHDEDCDRAMAEVAQRHGWSEAEVARLRRLRRALAPAAAE